MAGLDPVIHASAHSTQDKAGMMSMAEQQIEPAKIRTPIQLLAAWLLGLILVNGSFLAAAATLQRPDWAAGLLVVCAALNVPVFIGAIFLLQTRFRPQMQEDAYYSQYLKYSQETGKTELVAPAIATDFKLNFENTLTSLSRDWLGKSPGRSSDLSSPIHVNDLLPKYRDMALAFRKIGIEFKTFGSSSKVASPPNNFVIAIGKGFSDLPLLRIVVEITRQFGLDGIALSDAEETIGKVLIGAYTFDRERLFLSVKDQHFDQILETNKTWDDLAAFIPQS